MSRFQDDEAIMEFRGGTLQLSTTEVSLQQSQDNTNEEHSGMDKIESAPSVLSGVNSISSSTATLKSASDDGMTKLLPSYELPFGCETIEDYFASRDGIVENAIRECVTALIFPQTDGEVIGSWLLTQITLWDNEKERLLLLTNKYLYTVKYDFIALKKIGFIKTCLSDLDTILIGNLVYPSKSIVPRLNGFANGVTTVVKDHIIDKIICRDKTQNNSEDNVKLMDKKYFEPRERNLKGIRLMWNKGEEIPFKKLWNPFNEDVPFLTFTSHPLYFHRDNNSLTDISTYSVQAFSDAVLATMSNLQCCINHTSIVIENYVGVASVLHNKSSLGFFKVRGKVSF